MALPRASPVSLSSVIAVPLWLFVLSLIYASCYFEGNARGSAALRPAAFIYACFSPALVFPLVFYFVADGGARDPMTALPPLGVSALPSPCPMDSWLRRFKPPVPFGGAFEMLAAATAFELLVFLLLFQRFGSMSSRAGLFGTLSATDPNSAIAASTHRRLRHRSGAALSEMIMRFLGFLSNQLAILADVPCAILFLVPDASLILEAFGFSREAAVFRFSTRATTLAVLVALTLEVGCAATRAQGGEGKASSFAPSALGAPTTDPLLPLYLCTTWSWRALVSVSDCWRMIYPRLAEHTL
jgi:hypothetical protein